MSIVFQDWSGVLRLLVVAPLAYLALVAILRVSGKRTLSKFNAFDFVVTIALGSTLASVILDRAIPLAEGVLALALLVALQVAITFLSVRSRAVDALAKSEPTLLVRDGALLEAAMTRQRVTADEVQAALRAAGLPGLDRAAAVILETDGSMNVIPKR